MSVFWSEGVRKRNLSVPRFVELTSANPARIFGLYGTKGVLRPGADADIVVMDDGFSHTYRQGENQPKNPLLHRPHPNRLRLDPLGSRL